MGSAWHWPKLSNVMDLRLNKIKNLLCEVLSGVLSLVSSVTSSTVTSQFEFSLRLVGDWFQRFGEVDNFPARYCSLNFMSLLQNS